MLREIEETGMWKVGIARMMRNRGLCGLMAEFLPETKKMASFNPFLESNRPLPGLNTQH